VLQEVDSLTATPGPRRLLRAPARRARRWRPRPRLENGSDTHGHLLSAIPFYQEWVRRWGIVVAQVQGICHDPPAARIPPRSSLAEGLTWCSEAVQAHRDDEQANPKYTDWDSQWVVVDQPLGADYRLLYR
jgi:hypothetical protein